MNKQLEITVNLSRRECVFSGDTFLHKEKIKSLGTALWDSKHKAWVLKNISVSVEQIETLFPSAAIRQVSEDVSEVKETVFSTGVTVVETITATNSALEKNAISVTDLLQSIRAVLQSTFSKGILIYGILSSVKKLSNGRIYFDLIDEKESTAIRCVLWENNTVATHALVHRGIEIEDNTPVMMRARVSFNPKSGSVSITVDGFIPEYTLGKIQANRDRTNAQLREEGLFDRNKSLQVPFLPQNLGIITSDAGTVINDFMASLSVCQFGFTLYWYKTRVQGEYAEKDICNGIDYFSSRKDIDAILIFRGGGSVTELSVFNNYTLAKKVCMSSVPIVSAIGHEYDQCAVQDVSCLHFGVPKDIGRFFSDLIIKRRDDLRASAQLIHNMIFEITRTKQSGLSKQAYEILKYSHARVEYSSTRVKNVVSIIDKVSIATIDTCARTLREVSQLTMSLVGKTFLAKQSELLTVSSRIRSELNKKYNLLQIHISQYTKITQAAMHAYGMIEQKLEFLSSFLISHAPEIQLKRGYAFFRKFDSDTVVSTKEAIASEEKIVAVLHDGEVVLKVCNDI